MASWLPLHHDMGLIGCFVAPVVSGCDLWLMTPEQFVHRPLAYLRCFGERGARLTAMPTFALDHITRRVRPDQLSGLDFSQWRAMIVGSEQVRAGSFERVHRLLAPFGFERRAILPAYGLAEATLAVTGLPLDEVWRTCPVETAELALGRPVTANQDGRSVPVVGCGHPLVGTQVRIVGRSGAPLPAGVVGEIEVRGASVATGYTRIDGTAATRLVDGVLRTGDAGFVLDGQLFVLGRLGDALKVRGRTVFAEDVEERLGTLVPEHVPVAVALGVHGGQPTAVVLVAWAGPPGSDDDRDRVVDRLTRTARRLTDADRVLVHVVPRSAIPRTTSGKIRRRAVWRSFVEDTPSRLTPGQAPATAGSAGGSP